VPLLPSAAAHATLRRSGQAAAENFIPGTVTIGGAEFAAAVTMDPVMPELEAGGNKLMQWLHIRLSKDVLTAAPAHMAEVLYQGLTFTLRRVSGHEDAKTAWLLDCKRTVRPGEV